MIASLITCYILLFLAAENTTLSQLQNNQAVQQFLASRPNAQSNTQQFLSTRPNAQSAIQQYIAGGNGVGNGAVQNALANSGFDTQQFLQNYPNAQNYVTQALQRFLRGATFTGTARRLSASSNIRLACYQTNAQSVVALPRALMPRINNAWNNVLCENRYWVEVSSGGGSIVLVKPKYILQSLTNDIEVDSSSFAQLTRYAPNRASVRVSYRLYQPVPTLY